MRILICILVLMASGCGFHQNTQQLGEAMDPMRTPIRMRLPDHIRTIGGAAQYYADTVNCRLVTSYPAPKESSAITSNPINPLAPIDTGKVFPIEEGILMLLDDDDWLVIDQEHKLFSFEKGILE